MRGMYPNCSLSKLNMCTMCSQKKIETAIFSISLKMFADGMASENRSKINRFWVSKSHQIHDFHDFGSKNPQTYQENPF